VNAKRCAVLVATVLLAGCASSGARPPSQAPVAVAIPEPAPVPAPAPAPEAAPAPAAPPSSAGVGYLVAAAERQVGSGQYEQAAASLERALRLEPKNARLWHRLARVRFDQGQWSQSVQFAQKSNQLSGTDRALRTANFQLLAESYNRLGQWQKAEEARRMAGRP
jgi:tetratricopeptide (TPR) repeat protein